MNVHSTGAENLDVPNDSLFIDQFLDRYIMLGVLPTTFVDIIICFLYYDQWGYHIKYIGYGVVTNLNSLLNF